VSLSFVGGAAFLAPALLAAALFAAALLAAAPPVAAESGLERSPSPEGARVYFIAPADGEKLVSPFLVRFGLSQMGVAPAGTIKDATGHHHLIVDADLPPSDLPVPASDNYRHFGMGQTEAELSLPPGKHTLQLILGDHMHIPHDPPIVSERITVIVEAPAPE
jgi:hypothetical protein